jgi:hypothetical protein
MAATMLALLAAASPYSAAADDPPAFPDGDWHGTSYYGGQIENSEVWVTGGGDIVFDMTVEDANVTDGTLVYEIDEMGLSETAAGQISFTGSMQMSGTAAVVEFAGTASMQGTITSGGIDVPIEFSGPSAGKLSPTYVTCNEVSGDLATEAREAQEAAGFTTNVTGLFVALKTGGSGSSAEAIMAEYVSLTEAIVDLLGASPSPQQIVEMVKQSEALAAKIAGIAACGGSLPQGFQSGLSNNVIGSLFQDLLQKALDDPDAYTAQELLALLAAGIRMGAVGKSVPGSAPFKDFAKNLLVQFEATLDLKLEAAAAAGDKQTILDILIGAQIYGLDDLADKAQGLLAGG